MIEIDGATYFTRDEIEGSFYYFYAEDASEGGIRLIVWEVQMDYTIVHNIVEADTIEQCMRHLMTVFKYPIQKCWVGRRAGKATLYWQPDEMSLMEAIEIEYYSWKSEKVLADKWVNDPESAQAECMLALVGA